MATANTVAHQAHNAAERTVANPALEFLERVGYVVRGVLYAVMGALALGLALGVGGTATDPTGSVLVIASYPAGRAILLCVVFGLFAYAIWGFVRAIFDPLHRGKKAGGIAHRLGFFWSGIAYSSIALFALRLLVGDTTPNHRDSTQAFVARVLTVPSGKWIAVGIGFVAIAVGIGQFIEAYRATFRNDLKREEMTQGEREVVDQLGRLGYAARGVVFTLVGWFVLQGGLHKDSGQVHGYGGAFLFLLAQPYGRLLLGAVAIGFVALGLHSFACARWVRLLGSR